MKRISRFLKSSKTARFLLIFILSSLLIIIFSIPFSPTSSMDVYGSCTRQTSERYCVFNCEFKVSEKNVTARILVIHSGLTAIFDKEFEMEQTQIEMEQTQTEFVEIQLPKRDYIYTLRGGFYNENNYGILLKGLQC